MRIIGCLFLACALEGCLPAVQVRSAPAPTPQEMVQIRTLQTRVIAASMDSIFPRVIEVLMDNDYVVRSVDAQAGFVSFYQQWMDPSQAAANITEEGSILFTAAGSGQTQVRVILTGGWQRLQVTGGGAHSTDSGMVGGVQQSAGDEEYKKILDTLQSGLTK